MLAAVGAADLDDLVAQSLPTAITETEPLRAAAAADRVAGAGPAPPAWPPQNRPGRAMIGLGYHGTVTPAVIRRNVLEDPAWYTAYTPYQPEISQGRLEALLNFQTMIADLTGLPIAGASLLDEATAVAEAMTLARRTTKTGTVLLLDADTLPQTIAVVRTRAEALGLAVEVAEDDLLAAIAASDPFAVVVQTPGASGRLADTDELRAVADAAHAKGAEVIAACDLLALTAVTPPGEWGADIAVGSSQRFGVPLFYGGPHAGFISVRAKLERSLPGRLVGVSRDAHGTQAYRLALQTREQHIRREKATSNICTAQVLLAVTASMYAVYHGPHGLAAIAAAVHGAASAAGRRPDRRWRRGGARRVLRHRARSRAGTGRRRRPRGPGVRGAPAAGRRRPRGHLDRPGRDGGGPGGGPRRVPRRWRPGRGRAVATGGAPGRRRT